MALGMGAGYKPWTSCQLSIAIEFRKRVPVRKGVGWGKKRECYRLLPTGRAHVCWVLCLQAFLSFFTGRTLRGGLKGEFQQNINKFSRCDLSRSLSPLISQWQVRGILVIAIGSGVAYLFILHFWAW